MARTILVTGGAGYIGSHVVKALQEAGCEVVVVDDLSTGRESRLTGVELYELDLSQPDVVPALMRVMMEHDVDAVVHTAAKKSVSESTLKPELYRAHNVAGTRHVLRAMRGAGVRKLLFSSSAAVYGQPSSLLVREETPCAPMSVYGMTKVEAESILRLAEVGWGLRYVALRYFNVIGAGATHMGDSCVENLLPRLLMAAERGEGVVIHGDDYPTRDGTCVRDWVHVLDVAAAHVAALASLDAELRVPAFNIGSGVGATVLEVVEAVRQVTGAVLPVQFGPRRGGDPASLVADVVAAREVLGWSPRGSLEDAVASAWGAHLWWSGERVCVRCGDDLAVDGCEACPECLTP